MSNLVKHAERELKLIGGDYCEVQAENFRLAEKAHGARRIA